ncbi:MAG: hypothetical protein A2710_11445 [Burkholderiales bacterium RIFCSPHIGHO2_01_FULL_64_960]|jgi:hypothetical protein|nr:MAG: hypothetical protein A2710_11445 [Burkholderiales bacterium RIFCSPHIGHO2_01_FULL_64_960]OGB07084.1 MAG: hypothetical protein A3C40_12800 [Burkholderiales bacterium RIFCSPHIGHO2_02_FULL_64_19]OGB24782.1 MAG: hypothetical protein A3E23_04640 [Burkholderiales bacterium RIFCSPHIGHO2_12_FULL_65_48]OGB57731.1 MAG: hypothetical protein A3F71_24845 [Burkholderiales bacterium RIFCSPLOWO2_12_FULL_64_33]
MKLSQLILAVAVSACGTAFAADNHGHDIKPMHGGAVAEAKEVEYELVASADKLQLYMRDHGKPVAVTGMTAKVTLLAGSDKQDVQLQAGDGKLEATGSFKVPTGTKVVVAVSKAGKSVTSVRFTLK